MNEEDRNMECTEWVVAERDAALKKVAELTECLRWYVENDETNEGGRWEEINAHWIKGKRRAQRALGGTMSVEAEARRLSAAVDRLERESLEILAALGLHEDTPHEKVLEHIRVLMQEHNEMRMVIEGHRYRFNKENPMSHQIPVPEMVSIPAPPGETYTLLEGDGQPVPLAAFSIGRYPVTQAEWQPVMGTNPSHFKGDPRLPVESVSWHEATTFCDRLSDAHGLIGDDRYRLPTEAEWEWAASGGVRGDQRVTDDTGWYSDNSDKQTHPVGEKKPNGFGLHDVLGNVCEWTATEWSAGRVYRGGGWDDDPGYARVAFRGWIEPGFRFGDLGFRLARGGK